MTGTVAQTPTRTGEHLLLYDGVCGLCNRLTAFVLPRDSRGLFDFASLQSATARSLLRRLGDDGAQPDGNLETFYVLKDYRSRSPALISKSRAALFVLRTLGGPWRAVSLLGLFPTALLDIGYDLIARNRYRWFGRHETCLMPDPAYRGRFIDV